MLFLFKQQYIANKTTTNKHNTYTQTHNINNTSTENQTTTQANQTTVKHNKHTQQKQTTDTTIQPNNKQTTHGFMCVVCLCVLLFAHRTNNKQQQ
jgi:hypothetical protein